MDCRKYYLPHPQAGAVEAFFGIRKDGIEEKLEKIEERLCALEKPKSFFVIIPSETEVERYGYKR